MGGSEVGAGFLFDEERHRYTVAGMAVPGITQILKLTGFVEASWFTRESRERGTAVHRACWYMSEKALDWQSVDPTILPRVEQFADFLEEYKPALVAAPEQPLYSFSHGFAGTPDFIFTVMGHPSIIEVKTGRAGLAAKLQTAAQKILIEENLGIKDIRRFAFELSGEGRYKFVPHTDHGDKVMFLNAVSMVRRRINEGELKL